MQYTLISDPGHAWLSVPTVELLKLGISGDISPFSYMSPKGNRCYLEEDCDLAVFLRAKEEKNQSVSITNRYTENTRIRGYPGYQSAWIEENKEAILRLWG